MKVTAEQFKNFLDTYGKEKLTRDVTGICEPPRAGYYDFTEGKVWPEALVAQIVLNDAMDDKNPPPNEYIVMDEFAHLVKP